MLYLITITTVELIFLAILLLITITMLKLYYTSLPHKYTKYIDDD